MRTRIAALALIVTAVGADVALAQRGPAVGRERQDLFIDLTPRAPQIQLRDGKPSPVIQTPSQKKKPAKRKRSRSSTRN
jgi:hypothetical protein